MSSWRRAVSEISGAFSWIKRAVLPPWAVTFTASDGATAVAAGPVAALRALHGFWPSLFAHQGK
eukprot:2534901-Alexandrium_andersonii.AAC.1